MPILTLPGVRTPVALPADAQCAMTQAPPQHADRAFEGMDLSDLLVDACLWLAPDMLERIAAALDARPLPVLPRRDATLLASDAGFGYGSVATMARRGAATQPLQQSLPLPPAGQ